jgi:septum formation protein
VPADIDESSLPRETPKRYVARLAKAKAEKIAALYPRNIILAADTVVVCAGRVLGKADTLDQVVFFLNTLSGKTHRVLTAIHVLAPGGKQASRITETKVTFKRLTQAEIAVYAAGQEGIGKAGGYAIQGHAGAFIIRIQGSYTNVVGLPLYETRNALLGVGGI